MIIYTTRLVNRLVGLQDYKITVQSIMYCTAIVHNNTT